jgi:salicylate hydroxylase
MTSETVLIIGCGVAGPVLALLLKKKGYTPVVLEKVTLGDVGGSLMMMPNGYDYNYFIFNLIINKLKFFVNLCG